MKKFIEIILYKHKMNSFVPSNTNEQKLTQEECEIAIPTLYNQKPFRTVNRKLYDPVKHGEPRFALFSFAKASGATPDSDGFLGVAKIRGVFHTDQEAADRAEEIIRDVDSSNSIFTTLCGAPFPLVVRGCSQELSEVDISKKVDKIISDNVRAKRKAEAKEIEEIEERRKALVNDDGTINESEDPEDMYVQQRVKLAHLRYAIKEHGIKLRECSELEKTVRTNLNECKSLHPEYEENFVKRYKEGRRRAKIPESTDFGGFMKYFLDPIDPPEPGSEAVSEASSSAVIDTLSYIS